MTPRHAVFAAFIAFGAGYGLWAGAIASVALRSGMTPQLLGYAVTTFIAASLLGMAGGGVLSRSRSIKTLLLCSIALAMAALTVLLNVQSPAGFLAGITAFGLVAGAFDGLMNAEGTAVEAEIGRPVLAGFHASASFASAATAILGSLVMTHGGPLATAFLACLVYGAALIAVRRLTPRRAVAALDDTAPPQAWRFNRPIVLLGLIVGICIAGEMAAIMFSAPALAAQSPELAAYAGFGATAFSLCQGLVRCWADRFRRRLGDLRVMELSILGAALGFAVVATSTSFAQSAVGFALIGAGTGCLVPCGFSLAPRYAGLAAAQALGVLALVTALPRIPAPLVFGEMAERFAYPVAFAVNGLLFALALALTAWLRRRPQAQAPAPVATLAG